MVDKQNDKNVKNESTPAPAATTGTTAPATDATTVVAPPVVPGAEKQQVFDPNAITVKSRVVTCVDPLSTEGTVISRSQLILREYAKGLMTRSELVAWYNTNVADVQGLAHITYQTVRGIVHATIAWNQADLNRKAVLAQKKEAEAQAKVEREKQKAAAAEQQAAAIEHAKKLQAAAQARAEAGNQAAAGGAATAAPATATQGPASDTAPTAKAAPTKS